MNAYILEEKIAAALRQLLGSGVRVATSVNADSIERPFVLVSASQNQSVEQQRTEYGVILNSDFEISAISGNSNDQNWKEQHLELCNNLFQNVVLDINPLADAVGTNDLIEAIVPTGFSAQTSPNSQIDTILAKVWHRTFLSYVGNFSLPLSVTGTKSIRHRLENQITDALINFLPEWVKNSYQIVPAYNDSELEDSRIVACFNYCASEIMRINTTPGATGGFELFINTLKLTEFQLHIKIVSAFTNLETHNLAAATIPQAINEASIGPLIYPSGGGLPYRLYVIGSLQRPQIDQGANRQLGDFSVTDSFSIAATAEYGLSNRFGA